MPSPLLKYAEQPGVFIVGSGRSGTTLLRLILDSHTDMAISDESEFLACFSRYRHIQVHAKEQINRVVDDLIHFFMEMYPGEQNQYWLNLIRRFQDEIIVSSASIVEILQSVYCVFIRESGKPIWGDNTPQYLFLIPFLKTLFPNIKIIHLIRDGRDVHLSMANLPWGPNNITMSAHYWKHVMNTGEQYKQSHQGSWMDVRYEDLLQEPATCLSQICRFLDVTYEPSMLDFYKTAEEKLPEHLLKTQFQKTTSPIDPKNSYKWKKRLNPDEVRIFERIAGKELAQFGYEVSTTDGSPSLLEEIPARIHDFTRRLTHLCRDPFGGKTVIKYKYILPAYYRIAGLGKSAPPQRDAGIE